MKSSNKKIKVIGKSKRLYFRKESVAPFASRRGGGFCDAKHFMRIFELRDGKRLTFCEGYLEINSEVYDYDKIEYMGYRPNEGAFTFRYLGDEIIMYYREPEKMNIAQEMKQIKERPKKEVSLDDLIIPEMPPTPEVEVVPEPEVIPEPEAVPEPEVKEMPMVNEPEQPTYDEPEEEEMEYGNSMYDFYADFVGEKKAEDYVERFMKIEAGGRTWNWFAFLCGPYWMLYRRMVAYALVFFFGLSVIVTVASSVLTPVASSIIPVLAYVAMGLFGDQIYKRRIDGLYQGNHEYALLKYGGTRKRNVIIAIILSSISILLICVAVVAIVFAGLSSLGSI